MLASAPSHPSYAQAHLAFPVKVTSAGEPNLICWFESYLMLHQLDRSSGVKSDKMIVCYEMENTRNEAYFKQDFGICQKELKKLKADNTSAKIQIKFISHTSQMYHCYANLLWSISSKVPKTQQACII
jgi:hypothetical protein